MGDMDVLGVSTDAQMLRALSKDLDVPLHKVEALYQIFDDADSDGSGYICLAEFERMIAKMHNIENIREVFPPGRIRMFFQQCSAGSSTPDEVNFFEFLDWFIRNFDLSSMEPGHNKTMPIAENLYKTV